MYGIVRTTVRQAACRRVPIGCLVTVCALVGILLLPSTARAQAVTGTLLGNVTDSSGAGVPGATVTALEVQTNTSRTAVTNEAGNYIFSSLRNGTYTVNAEIQGFKKVERPNVKVEVNTTVRVDMKLEVGQINETLTVSAESPLLQTDRTDTGRILESKMVSELPLTFNRNFQSLLITVPGVTRPHREHSQFFNSQDSLRFEVNGQPGMASNTLIEGLDDNQKTGLLQVIIPAADALETVSVSTSNYDAEFGRSGGAVTNVTIKSGTNDLKGSAFFFGNNEKTNAGDYFSHIQAPTKFVNGGFTLGGPIVKGKLFFFGDYQRTVDNNGYVVRTTVPTVKMRSGDFSEVSDPNLRSRSRATSRARTARRSRTTRFRRIGSARSRRTCSASFRCRTSPVRRSARTTSSRRRRARRPRTGSIARSTTRLSAKDQISYRLSFMRPVVFDPGLFGQYGGPANGGLRRHGHEYQLQQRRHVDARVQRQDRSRRSGRAELLPQRHGDDSAGADDEHGRGYSGRQPRRLHQRPFVYQHRAVSGIRCLGSLPASRGIDPRRRGTSTATLTRLLHNHTVKLGGEWRHNRDLLLQTQDAGGPRGRFNFNCVRHRPAERVGDDSAASPIRWRRSCSTGRTPCSAT